MRGFAAAAVVFGSALVGSSAGAEHLLDRATLDQVLSDRAEQRRTDLAKLDGVLSTSRAERAVESMSADPLRVRTGLSSLSDGELRDLAQRAAALEVDPGGGLSADVNTLLVIFLIVAIVVLVLSAV